MMKGETMQACLQKTAYMGILVREKKGTIPFAEQSFYRRLTRMGRRSGLHLFVFSPLHIDWEKSRIVGYAYKENLNGWQKGIFPFPQLVYDRFFAEGEARIQDYRENIQKLQLQAGVSFLGYGLKGKWHVHKALSRHALFARHLPRTEKYKHHDQVITWLKQEGSLFIKPHGGSQGKGAAHIERVSGPALLKLGGSGASYRLSEKPVIRVEGRDRENRVFHAYYDNEQELIRWLQSFIAARKYIIQSFLELTNHRQEPFDLRSLMQKNGQADWQLTGMAVRCGTSGSVTSNLHGGGQAESAEQFLTEQFGEQAANRLLAEIRSLSYAIAPYLESRFGRLVELGIDFGIDRHAEIWILEVNSKPGRSAFTKLCDKQAAVLSLRNPIQYARHLFESGN